MTPKKNRLPLPQQLAALKDFLPLYETSLECVRKVNIARSGGNNQGARAWRAEADRADRLFRKMYRAIERAPRVAQNEAPASSAAESSPSLSTANF